MACSEYSCPCRDTYSCTNTDACARHDDPECGDDYGGGERINDRFRLGFDDNTLG